MQNFQDTFETCKRSFIIPLLILMTVPLKLNSWWYHLLSTDIIISLQQVNVKKSKKSPKIANIDEENLDIFWTTCWISMEFSGKHNSRKTTAGEGGFLGLKPRLRMIY